MKNKTSKRIETYRLLVVDDVCATLHLGKTKVFELIKQRAFPSFKIDGARRIRESHLVAYIEMLEPSPVSQRGDTIKGEE